LKTKYTDFNTRSLIEWERVFGKFVSNLKVATTAEEYRCFGNITSDFYTTATVNSLIAKYGLDYAITNNMLLILGANYTRNDGQGSDIQAETRNLAAAIVGFKHKISKSVLYEISLRQEANAAYGSPLLYSAGMSAQLT